jgi:predicted metal-dependent hydrolase
MNGRDELRRELEARALATPPADLAPFAIPTAIAGEERVTFARGLTAFRVGEFYLAHDLWEEVWHGYRGSDRRFLQGLIHLAVGSYHVQCGNPKGARSQLAKAADKMGPYRPQHWGIAVDDLLARAAKLSAVDYDDQQAAESALARLKKGVEPA